MTIASCFIGIDVSKGWLDCYIHPQARRYRLANDAKGHAALVELLERQGGLCVLEATALMTGRCGFTCMVRASGSTVPTRARPASSHGLPASWPRRTGSMR